MKKFLIWLLLLSLGSVFATKIINCPINSSIKIDGVISPNEWSNSWQSKVFHLFSYNDSRPSIIPEPIVLDGNPTNVKMAYSPDYLHILFQCKLKDNYQWKHLVKNGGEKDIHDVDTVEVFIRPNRSMDFYQFAVSIAGKRFDANGTVSRLGTRVHSIDWNNNLWKSAVKYTKNSYTVEMAIPWKIFQIEPGNFYVNFNRTAKSYGENQSYLPLKGRAWAQPQNFAKINFDMALVRPVYVDNNVLPEPVMGNNSFAPFFINATKVKQTATAAIIVNNKKVLHTFNIMPESRLQVPIVYSIKDNSGFRTFTYSVKNKVLFQGENTTFNLSGTFTLHHPVQRNDRNVTGCFVLPFDNEVLKNSTVHYLVKTAKRKIVAKHVKYSEVLNLGKFAPGAYQAELELRNNTNQVLYKKVLSFNVIQAPIW